jgi:hypothetical protein
MNWYEAKQEARRDRLEARAERLRGAAHGAFKRADMSEAATGIPFGQPILVGHHSEGRHRAAIARADRAMRKGVELSKAATRAESRAAGVGSGGISSDDPDAIAKLRAELAPLEARQAMMKAANGIIRRHKGEAAIPHLIQQGLPASVAAKLIEPDFCGRLGFADYQLTNNSANMRRIRQRIAALEARIGAESKETEAAGGLRIIENVDENRLQMFFPGKPCEAVRAELKACGFRWAPSEGAWQRQLSNAARYGAECVTRKWEAAQ